MTCRTLLFLVCELVGLAACRTTSNLSFIQIEMMKPAQFTLSGDVTNIAIFKRDLFQTDTIPFKYHDLSKHIDLTDSLVHYRDLSNKCVAELANSLIQSGKFLKVVNYSDTMNLLFASKYSSFNYNELHNKTGADVCIFLDNFYLKDHIIKKNAINLGQEIYNRFPEFKGSTKLESIEPSLIWIISFYGNPTVFECKQPEKLFYGNNLYPTLFDNDENHRLLLNTVAEYLGNTFTEKLIPSSQKVERTYYSSKNVRMQKGEKYLKEGDWLKAAEIYKKETKNKNQNIAAKATYNMALICEMEGKVDAATDWLDRSHSVYKRDNFRYIFDCKQYDMLLDQRKVEMKRLEKQIRPHAEN